MRQLISTALALGMTLGAGMATADEGIEINEHGIASTTSSGPLEDVDTRLRAGLEKRGMGLMAVVDHAANAAGVELDLPPTRTFIFGKPEVGTKLMQCQGSVALDLPQKMLVREHDGGVLIQWNDPHYLATRHGLEACELPIDKIAEVLSGLALEAAGDR